MKLPAAVSASLVLVFLLGCGVSGPGFDPFADPFPIEPLNENVRISLTSISGSGFCCDPDKGFPQDIGTLQVINDYLDLDIFVVIGPLAHGVVTEDGPVTNITVRPGGVLSTKLRATHCDWTVAEGNLLITTGIDPRTEHGTRLDRKILLENDCPLQRRIKTGLEVTGLARAYFDGQNDPPPVGTDPVLYVIGPSSTGAIEAYAIKTNPTTGRITGTPKVDTVAVSSIGDDDIVAVSAGAGANLRRALYMFGPGGFARTHWAGTAWGGLQLFGTVKDMVSYGGGSRSSGVSYATGLFARFQEFDPGSGFFITPTPTGQLGGEFHFPGRTGDPVSVFVDEASRGAIIVMDGSPGQIWFHDRVDAIQKATLVGVAGNDPREVRAKNGLAAISNYGSGTVTLMTWGGAFAPLPAGTLDFAASPIANPLKLDMVALDNGNTALAVASATTDRWWLGELNAVGAVVNSWTGTYGGAGGLADVVIIPGPTTYLAVALEGFVEVLLVETELKSPAAQ